MGVRIFPHGKGHSGGHTWACPDLPRSTFLELFARGSSDAASGYQYCSNLFCLLLNTQKTGLKYQIANFTLPQVNSKTHKRNARELLFTCTVRANKRRADFVRRRRVLCNPADGSDDECLHHLCGLPCQIDAVRFLDDGNDTTQSESDRNG